MGPTAQKDLNIASPSAHVQGKIEQHVLDYAANPLFRNISTWTIENNPFRRPIRSQDLRHISFTAPVSCEKLCSTSALAAQRMLLNIYECDLMFLPASKFSSVINDFRGFYSPDNRLAGEMIRTALERYVFNCLDSKIHTSGKWSLSDMISFFNRRLDAVARSETPVEQAVLSAKNPQEAATTFLVQLASDFLTEASAMARNMPGNFGPVQSELFKVLIDEYGYGVHQAKHSTLFEETLASHRLSAEVHTYWQFYLASSLALTNYFHFVSKNHEHFFRYLGALYYTEATLVNATRQHSKMLRTVLGKQVDTRYFDEHTHIDQHHARMVIDNIIKPIVKQCGEKVIPEIVRGFEEFHLLQDIADKDLLAQITWSDQREVYKKRAQEILTRVKAGDIDCDCETFTEPASELSVNHVHNVDELMVVEDGTMELVTGYGQSVTLGPNEGIIIPRHRLHGSVVLSQECTYRAYSLGDYELCLS